MTLTNDEKLAFVYGLCYDKLMTKSLSVEESGKVAKGLMLRLGIKTNDSQQGFKEFGEQLYKVVYEGA